MFSFNISFTLYFIINSLVHRSTHNKIRNKITNSSCNFEVNWFGILGMTIYIHSRRCWDTWKQSKSNVEHRLINLSNSPLCFFPRHWYEFQFDWKFQRVTTYLGSEEREWDGGTTFKKLRRSSFKFKLKWP